MAWDPRRFRADSPDWRVSTRELRPDAIAFAIKVYDTRRTLVENGATMGKICLVQRLGVQDLTVSCDGLKFFRVAGPNFSPGGSEFFSRENRPGIGKSAVPASIHSIFRNRAAGHVVQQNCGEGRAGRQQTNDCVAILSAERFPSASTLARSIGVILK